MSINIYSSTKTLVAQYIITETLRPIEKHLLLCTNDLNTQL